MTTTQFSRDETLLWLQHLDVFSDVPSDELALLLDGMEWLELRGSQVLGSMGSGTHVYFVRYGSLGGTIDLGQGRDPVQIAPIGPGEMLGEIGAIAGGARKIAVVALRHCGLLQVPSESFRRFLERSHRGTLQVTRHLAASLTKQFQRRSQAVRPASIALVAAAQGVDLMEVGHALIADAAAQNLAAELLSRHGARLGADEVAAAQMLNDLTVLVTSDDDPQWNELCLANADRLLFVDAPGHAPLPEPALPPGRQADVVILCPDGSAPQPVPPRWHGRADIALTLHVRRGRAEDMRFLARVTGGRAIGLVLAGGGARGFAHLGVIRAMREVGIPIDLLGGTSMGGIIAAGAGFEWTDEELMDRMHKVFAVTNPVGDYTLPIVSLSRGNAVATRLRHHFGYLPIESAWRPFFTVSANLSTSAVQVHRTGPIWRALRATSALPAILPPVIEDGHVLVDGGVMNNFPVDVMQDMRRGPVIGVDMPSDYPFTSSLGDFETMGAWRLLRTRKQHPINVFSLLNRTASSSSLPHTRYCRSRADLLLDPEVRDVGVLQWGMLRGTAQIGYEHAMRAFEAGGVTYASLLARGAPPG